MRNKWAYNNIFSHYTPHKIDIIKKNYRTIPPLTSYEL